MTQANQTIQLLLFRARTTGQGNMSGTSVTQDTQWLVQLSKDVFQAEIGLDIHQDVSDN